MYIFLIEIQPITKRKKKSCIEWMRIDKGYVPGKTFTKMRQYVNEIYNFTLDLKKAG